MKKVVKYSIISVFWLGVWQLAAMLVGQELLFPTPIAVAIRLFQISATANFYKVILYSLLRILLGMTAGSLIGTFGGTVTAFSKTAKAFFAPILAVVKATPVASFIILLVLYISRDLAPLIISLMIVTPIVWTGIESGIINTDNNLLEMAKVYKMNRRDILRHIYLPSITPYLLAALKSSLGMAWKAGIAAEVLLQPIMSIGKMISDSKILLETTDLFAWTVVVVILSVIIERMTLLVLTKAVNSHHATAKGGVNFG